MGKQIIDLMGELVKISGNSTVDGIIFAIISIIAFSVAFGLVGKIFDALGFYDSDIMSDVHWIIKVAVFGGLTYICVKIAQFVTWMCGFQWWIYLIALAVIITIIVLVHWLRYNYQMRKHTTIIIPNQQYTIGNKPEINTIEEPILTKNKVKSVKVYDRYRCPRCNSKLVKRCGLYGIFYGCESYGRTGCRYTRKYL